MVLARGSSFGRAGLQLKAFMPTCHTLQMADLQQRVLESAEGRDAARQEADRLESELADARAWKDRERSEALAEREERRRAERSAQEVVEREVRAWIDR